MKKVLLSTVVALSVLGMYGAQAASVNYNENTQTVGDGFVQGALKQQQADILRGKIATTQTWIDSLNNSIQGMDARLAGIENAARQDDQNGNNAGDNGGAWHSSAAVRREVKPFIIEKQDREKEKLAAAQAQMADLQAKLDALK